MLRRVTIERLDDPRLDPYRDQRDAWLKARHNPAAEAGEPPGPLFMAEGSLVISALLASPFRPHSLLGTPERVATIEPQLRAWAERQHPAPTDELPIYLAPRPLLEQIVGFDLHRGLLAAGHRATPRTPEALIRGSSLLIVAEDLSNHDNVGGLFRTAAALGGAAAGVLLSPAAATRSTGSRCGSRWGTPCGSHSPPSNPGPAGSDRCGPRGFAS